MQRSLSIVALINLLNALFPFLLLPILTHNLSMEDYGQLVLLEAFLAILTPVLLFSIAGVTVEYFRLSTDSLQRYLVNSIVIAIPVFFVAELLLLVSADFISERFSVSRDWLVVLPMILFFNLSTQIIASLYQCQKKYLRYAIFVIGPNISVFALTVVGLMVYDIGWEAKLYAMFISFVVFSLASYLMIYKECVGNISVDKGALSSNLNFTIPIVPHSITAALYFMADRLFLSELLGNKSVALYAAGMQLALVMSVIQNVISKAWNPFVFELIGKGKEDLSEAFKKLHRLMMVGCAFIFVIFIFCSVAMFFAVDYLLPSSFAQSKYLGIFLLGAYCLLGFYKVISPVLWFYKQSKSLSTVTMIVFVINLGLNATLIPIYGIYGACIATVGSFGAQLISTMLLVRKVEKEQLKQYAQNV